jgi:hypothetical protein
MKTAVLISGLLLILVANLVMVYYAPYGLSPMEGFQNKPMMNNANASMNVPANASANASANAPATEASTNAVEGFSSYYLENAGGAKETYSPVGAFDGVKLSTGNSVSGWRYTAPNEPLMGAEFQPGADSLFMFKNNQCKPECCGASFSCGGGCVCTTPQQRQYIAGRGGNRSEPEDSA